MKTMNGVLKQIDRILEALLDGPAPVEELTSGNKEEFKHALQDLMFSGMVIYAEVNPHLIVKRVM